MLAEIYDTLYLISCENGSNVNHTTSPFHLYCTCRILLYQVRWVQHSHEILGEHHLKR